MEAGKHGQSFGPLKLPRLTQEAKVHLGRFTSPGCGKGQGMKQAREKEEGGEERNINVAPRPKGSLRSGETIPRQDLLTRRFGICSQLSIRSSGWIEKLGKKICFARNDVTFFVENTRFFLFRYFRYPFNGDIDPTEPGMVRSFWRIPQQSEARFVDVVVRIKWSTVAGHAQ